MYKHIRYILFFVFIISQNIYALTIVQSDESNKQNSISYNGLTGTITEIIKKQPENSLSLGTYTIQLKKLLGKNISSILECDSTINNYLDNSDDLLYYEDLNQLIEDEIKHKFDGENGIIYIVVDESEQNYISHLSFFIIREMPVTIPVLIESVDKKLRVEYDMHCVIKLTIDCSLLIDSNEVNNGDVFKGIKIQFNTFSVELSSKSDEYSLKQINVQEKSSIKYNDKVYQTMISDLDFSAIINWYLNSNDTEILEDGDGYIFYEDIIYGNYRWDVAYDGQINFKLTSENENGIEPYGNINDTINFEYYASDLFFDDRYEEINLYINDNIEIGTPTISNTYRLN